MRFLALQLSLELIEALRPLVRTIRSSDRKLANQLVDAASSTPLNLGEGSRRAGRDRKHLFRIAAGSNEEVRTALRVAIAWGYLDKRRTADVLERIDRLAAVIHGLIG